MKLSDVIDALKAFFFDILGYLIPGFYALILLSYCINTKLQFGDYQSNNISLDNQYIVLLFSYLLGYVIYSTNSLTDFLIKLKFLKIKSQEDIEKSIEKGFEFEQAKKAIFELWVDNQNNTVIDNNSLSAFKARNLRNIVMSYIPEDDTKIYTFMFRSELCKNISSFSIIFSITALFFLGINLIFKNVYVFNNGLKFFILYIIIFVCSIFLLKTRMRFLDIAYRIPFSIFLSKYYKIV